MNGKKIFANVAITVISSVVGLLLCEWGSRLLIHPVDYLSPTLVRDDVLGIRLPGNSGGHDKWGFRNTEVPHTAEVVALGDSHTYGNCAKMNEAWPHVLARSTGASVYNLGMGGYGPNQYRYLLETKALVLKPKVIICAIYLGDDFDNAYRISYGLNYWSRLRSGELVSVDPDIWEKHSTPETSWQKRVRNWLSGHSVLYRLTFHGLLANAKGKYQVANATRFDRSAASLILPEKNLQEAFLPKSVLRGLNQEEQSVQEGMRITFKLLKEMNLLCVSNHINFCVAVIPTKETVFSRYLEDDLSSNQDLKKVIINERTARRRLIDNLKQENMHFIDLLPVLEKASETEKIYTFSANDMHPNKNGYRVIAEGISQGLKALTN
jgi:lysophospholipase L1-like esterase